MALGIQLLAESVQPSHNAVSKSAVPQLQIATLVCCSAASVCNSEGIESLTCKVSSEGSRREWTSVTAAMCMTCSAHVVHFSLLKS